jgi:hypothetical protein
VCRRGRDRSEKTHDGKEQAHAENYNRIPSAPRVSRRSPVPSTLIT